METKQRSLAGMVALVTGAGGGAEGGIGVGMARSLALAGARVAVNDLTAERAAATVELLRALGADAWPVPGNVADPVEATALVAGTVAQGGQIDILVNNAGIRGRSRVEDMPDEEWLQLLAVNLSGPFFTTRAAVRSMRPRGYGRIINIASIAACLVTAVSGAGYTAAKSGLVGLTRHVAAEVAQYGITANAIMPGYTAIPLLETRFTEGARSALARGIPAQRIGTPDDIGQLAAFLASREAGYINGTAIPVDGAISVLPGDYAAFRQAQAGPTPDAG